MSDYERDTTTAALQRVKDNCAVLVEPFMKRVKRILIMLCKMLEKLNR